MTEILDLDALIREHLAKGGTIQQVATGVTAEPAVVPVAARHDSLFSAETRTQRHNTRAQKKLKQDAPRVEQLKTLLDNPAVTAKALTEALGCSTAVLQRLFKDYFRGDPRIEPLLENTLEARTERYRQQALVKLREALAQGIRGHAQLSAHTGLGSTVIRNLAKKHKLDILISAGGRR